MALQKLSALTGASVHALDGDIGEVKDFYFDDERWVVRYVVVGTGGWLSRHRVVLSVMSLLAPDWGGKHLPIKLTRDQVRHSPDITEHPEVSRALEGEVLSYYGYPFYWAGDALWGPVSNPALAAEQAVGSIAAADAVPGSKETHLHSCNDVIGYHLHARDGEIGHIDDFVVDTESWAIEYLSVDTSNWIGGRSVMVEPSSIGRVDWAARAVRVNLSQETIATSPDDLLTRVRTNG